MQLIYNRISPLLALILLVSLTHGANNLSAQITPNHDSSFNQIVWDEIEVISQESNSDSTLPQVAVDDYDNFHVVWADSSDINGSGGDVDIFYKMFNTTTETWSDVYVISSESTLHSYNPSLTIDSNNNLHVVWQDQTVLDGSDPDSDIFYKMYNATFNSWGNTKVISTESIENSFKPVITVDNDDNLHVVWEDRSLYKGADTDVDIFYKRFDKDLQIWSDTFVVSSESTSGSYAPIIAIDSKNNLNVVWNDLTDINGAGVDYDIFYKKYDAITQSWESVEVISTESSSHSVHPSIAIDSDDNLNVVWDDPTDYNDAGNDIDVFFKIFYSSLQVWTSPIIVSIEGTGDSYRPKLIVDNYNNLHVVWYDNSDIGGGLDYDIFYKAFNYKSKVWTSITLISTGARNAFYPAISIDSKSNFHIVWLDQSDYNGAGITDDDIFYRSGRIIPEIPILDRISEVDDKNVKLNWEDIDFANQYKVFRDDEPIYDVSSLSPITVTDDSNYTDTIDTPGVYFYAIIASTPKSDSGISNIIHVEIDLDINAKIITQTENILSNFTTLRNSEAFIPIMLGGGFVIITYALLIRKIRKK